MFALTRRRAGRPAAIAAAALIFALYAYSRGYLTVAIPATAFALLAMLTLERALIASATPAGAGAVARACALTGVAVGCTTLFRHDFGLVAAAACVCALSMSADVAEDGRAAWRRLAIFAGGVLLVIGPAIAALLSAVPSADLYEQLVDIPTRVYAAHRSLPFPLPADAYRALVVHHAITPMLRLAVYLPPVVTVLGIAVLFSMGRRRAAIPAAERIDLRWYAALLVVNALLSIKGAIRVQLLHFLPALAVSVVLVTEHGRRQGLGARACAGPPARLQQACSPPPGSLRSVPRTGNRPTAPRQRSPCWTAVPARPSHVLAASTSTPRSARSLPICVATRETAKRSTSARAGMIACTSTTSTLYFLSGLRAATPLARPASRRADEPARAGRDGPRS